jgi:hypothetical protein
MRLLTASDFVDMPWKNGGGRTLQLAIHPPGATLENFDWRVSIATVERSGPFSSFPGCTRALMLLDGDGFELDIAGRRVVLDKPLEPVTFSGDEPVSCRLLGGPSRDFGVIARNGRAQLSILRGTDTVETTGAVLAYVMAGTVCGAPPSTAVLLDASGAFSCSRDAMAVVVKTV